MKKLDEKEIYEKRKENEGCLVKDKFIIAGFILDEGKEHKNICAIRLNIINKVERVAVFEEEGYDISYFYTYKNHKYITHLHFESLIKLINEALI